MVSSTARRALETAELAAAGCGCAGKVRAEPRLYEAEAKGYLRVLGGLPARSRCVLLVGHNPAIRQTAAVLLGCPPEGLRFVPAALACLEAPTGWASLRAGSCKLEWLIIPELAAAYLRGRRR